MAVNPNKTRSENALGNVPLQERHAWFVTACTKDTRTETVITIVVPADGLPLDSRQHGIHIWNKSGEGVPQLLDNSHLLHMNVLRFKNMWRPLAMLYGAVLNVHLPLSFMEAFKEQGQAWYLLTKRSFNNYAQHFANYIHRNSEAPNLVDDIFHEV